MSNITDNIDTTAKIAREVNNNMRSAHCSIICNKRKILAIGTNSRQTHPRAPKTVRGQYLHAEVAAILNAGRGALRGSVMYVVRVGKTNEQPMRISKPCKFCQAIISKVGIKKVYYSIDDGNIGCWTVSKDEWGQIKA